MRSLVLLCAMLAAIAWAPRVPQPAPVEGFFDLPVPGGPATLEALGLRPEERGMALGILARQVHGQGGDRAARRLADVLAGATGAGVLTIAAPLSAEAWREVVAAPADTDLFTAIVTTRGALLACAGALAAPPSMRALLGADRALLRDVVQHTPGAFTLAARSLRVEGGRLVVPGGREAEAAWESWLGARVERPAEFVRALLARDGGRAAWFFDTLASLDGGRLAAALAGIEGAAGGERMAALYAPFRDVEANWRIEAHPFLRHPADPAMALGRIGVDQGAIAAPAWAWLWRALFDRSDLPRRDAAAIEPGSPAPVALPWMTRQVAAGGPRERRARLMMIRFAQTVFGSARAEEGRDVLVALGGYRRYLAALLTLDRMDVASPHAYARLVDAARRVDAQPPGRRRDALVALQGALALVERVRVVRTIDAATAERLVLALAAAVDGEAPPSRAVAAWITGPFVAALPPLVTPDRFTGTRTAYESRILQAMAGPPPRERRALRWEGLEYVVDLAAAERDRLHRVRARLASPGLDAALDTGDAGRMSEALLALVYSAALGDPEGPALLGADIPSRHRFGFEPAIRARREEAAWLPPRELLGGGEVWHVEGALVGLDLCLARLAMRRLADDQMPRAPSINLNDQLTLARTVVALSARDLDDGDRDRLVEALAHGRARVGAAGGDLDALRVLADEARLPDAARQTLAWMLARAPGNVPALFGLCHFLWLGRPDLPAEVLDRWGAYAEPVDGRQRTAMPRPARWDDLGGRAESGVLGSHTPDLTLRLAEETARLHLPAALIPALLALATGDYWHAVSARTADDWPAMTREALALTGTRVEDYVAALAGAGPLR